MVMTLSADSRNPAVPEPEPPSPVLAQALLLPPEEAAHLLRVGRTQLFRLLASGELESVRIGRLRRVPYEACLAYVRRLRHEQSSHGDSR
jgi:excisionase family DNA binding protein